MLAVKQMLQANLRIVTDSYLLVGLFLPGVDGSWEFLVVGEPFLQLKSSVDASKTGEVVVSAEVWDIIKQRARGIAKFCC